MSEMGMTIIPLHNPNAHLECILTHMGATLAELPPNVGSCARSRSSSGPAQSVSRPSRSKDTRDSADSEAAGTGTQLCDPSCTFLPKNHLIVVERKKRNTS